jgi:hypothetical protein
VVGAAAGSAVVSVAPVDPDRSFAAAGPAEATRFMPSARTALSLSSAILARQINDNVVNLSSDNVVIVLA